MIIIKYKQLLETVELCIDYFYYVDLFDVV